MVLSIGTRTRFILLVSFQRPSRIQPEHCTRPHPYAAALQSISLKTREIEPVYGL